MSKLPDYDELPIKPDNPSHSAWGVWGDDDEVGALNLLTRDRVLDGASLVKTGRSFPSTGTWKCRTLAASLPPRGYLHMDVLALLGIPIGEMWCLDALAANCQADGVYEFFLTSAPLHKAGGIASPPNALAIKLIRTPAHEKFRIYL